MKSLHIAIIIVFISIALLVLNLPSVRQISVHDKPFTPVLQIPEKTKVAKTVQKEVISQDKKTPHKADENTIIATEGKTPDFSAIKDVKLKKSTFFKYMDQNIEPANNKVLAERKQLLNLIESYSKHQTFTDKENQYFEKLSKKYRVDKMKASNEIKLTSLKQKIDVVPASLILAQSANESAWGTSRFARKGNNYFGQWCYRKGCGLVPSARDSGSTHEVAKFSSVQKSVEEYIYNINVSRSYKKIRQLREQMVNANKTVDSLLLATGLEKYSERGKEYVKEIQSMIRYNKLQQYD